MSNNGSPKDVVWIFWDQENCQPMLEEALSDEEDKKDVKHDIINRMLGLFSSLSSNYNNFKVLFNEENKIVSGISSTTLGHFFIDRHLPLKEDEIDFFTNILKITLERVSQSILI